MSPANRAIAFLEVDDEDRQRILERFPDAIVSGSRLQDDDLLAQCAGCESISCFIYSRFGAEELAKLPKLKLLCTRSVGYDHIDMAACERRGITVCNVPDYGSHVIAEHVFALLLSTLRHINEADIRTAGGTFDYRGLRGMALRGKTIGIVGTGKIGRRVAQIAHGFGMKLLAVDVCRVAELSDLLGVRYVLQDELFAQSDIITLHVPALKDTEHMIDATALATMKDGVILINTARGSLIDSKALLDALESGKIGYALLDVLEHEQNFADNKTLIQHPHVVTTPHIAFYADDSMTSMYLDCFESIERYLQGSRPEHAVSPPKIVCDLPGIKRK